MALLTFKSGIIPLSSTGADWLSNVISQNGLSVANAQSVGGFTDSVIASDRHSLTFLVSA